MKRAIPCAAIALLAACGSARAQAPLLSSGFELSEEEWVVPIGNGKASIAHDAANVKVGKGSLKFEYKLEKGELTALIRPVEQDTLAGMKQLTFWVKADYPAPIAVSLQEKDGGRYIAVFMAPADTWQRVELAPSDFSLSTGPDDPKDPNGKLDVEKIEAIGILDIAQMFANSGDAKAAAAFGLKPGPHAFYLDDLQVAVQQLPGSAAASANDIPIDTFDRPQIGWFGVGGVKLSIANGKPLTGRGMRADYSQGPGVFSGLVRGLTPGKIAGATKMEFDVASAKPAKLILELEMIGGAKFQAMMDVEGGSALKHQSIPISEFGANEENKDLSVKLDPAKVHQIVFVELNGNITQQNAENTLYLGGIKAVK